VVVHDENRDGWADCVNGAGKSTWRPYDLPVNADVPTEGRPMIRTLVALAGALGVGALTLSFVAAQGGAARLAAGEWSDYAGDNTYGLKYSPLSQINKDSLDNLHVAWRWASADREVQKSNLLWRASRYEDTPLMVNGVLYTATPLGMVAAIDPATGQSTWIYDPESYKAGKPHSIGFTVRGLAYWTDGTAERIVHSTNDAYLISIDAKTGTPDPAFGEAGKVDLTDGFRDAKRSANFSGRRALIAGDIIVVGNAIRDASPGKEEQSPPGYVKAYDVRTGALLWTFHTIPKKGEVGYETWLEGSAERVGNANSWGGMSWDPELDFVYIPTSAPGHDYWGGSRPGDNLFSDSLVCVEAKTGKRVWHFQAIHHDLWDYDLVTHPALVDLTVDGARVKAVVGISKNSFIYVLDRATGKPVWPIVETPVPQATTQNRERTSPTQPFPSKPPAPETQGSTPENLIDFTPELRKQALEQLQHFEFGPLYTPPSVKGTLKVPGSLGGANWGGAAFDPETGVLYVPTRLTMDILQARFPDAPPGAVLAGTARGGGTAGTRPPATNLLAVEGLPLIKPPYARVTAIDLNKGEHLWMTPIGNGPRHHPLLKDLDLPPLGDAVLGGAPLVTKSLLFLGVTYTWVNGRAQPTTWEQWNDPGWNQKVLYVFDKASGAVLHVVEMEGHSVAAPMTYMHRGTQYLVVASGNGEESELVAFTVTGTSSN
jgi:quinoprotein glucose dehydrogenase